MAFIIIGAILIFVISIIWIWHNLGKIEKPRKIVFIVIGLLIVYLITLIIYQLTKGNIIYPNEEMQKIVSNTLILMFTGVNALILLPFSANILDKILEEEIDKNQAQKRLIILLIILIACVFIEKEYLKDTQEGIINIYNEVQNAEK